MREGEILWIQAKAVTGEITKLIAPEKESAPWSLMVSGSEWAAMTKNPPIAPQGLSSRERTILRQSQQMREVMRQLTGDFLKESE